MNHPKHTSDCGKCKHLIRGFYWVGCDVETEIQKPWIMQDKCPRFEERKKTECPKCGTEMKEFAQADPKLLDCEMRQGEAYKPTIYECPNCFRLQR